MHQRFLSTLSTLGMLALILSACSQPTPDVAAISTAAAQTVEARFTQQAAAATSTPLPATSTPTQTTLPTSTTPIVGAATPTSNGKACFGMTFLSETIPDGMIFTPGSQFTKTWQVRNDGNCVWDSSYALVLDRGDAMTSVTSYPLTQNVYPGNTITFSVPMTAPSTEGNFAGFWHVATPYGGFMGISGTNQSLSVKIQVSAKPLKDFGVSGVTYDMVRKPLTGCANDGASYTFTAYVTANGAGEVDYRWDRNPFDGSIVKGTLKFDSAGVKAISWTWIMTPTHVQGIDRWVALTTIVDTTETTWSRNYFNFTCTQ